MEEDTENLISYLPHDTLASIFCDDTRNLPSCALVCKEWNEISKLPYVWCVTPFKLPHHQGKEKY